MNDTKHDGILAAAELALALHRAPASHPELLRGETALPQALGVLLRLAGGTVPQEIDPDLAALAPADELRAAALFFVEQVLFRHNASHYRVLGLGHNASLEQVKQRHRLLMRLFHPDRESHPDERREKFAARINLAYNTLRDAELRSKYDETLKLRTTAPKPPQHRTADAARRPRPEPESFWTVRLYPVLMRYLPQWVLAGTALISLGIVGVVYLRNPPFQVPRSMQAPVKGSYEGNPPLAALSPEMHGEEAEKLSRPEVGLAQDLPAPNNADLLAAPDKGRVDLLAAGDTAPSSVQAALRQRGETATASRGGELQRQIVPVAQVLPVETNRQKVGTILNMPIADAAPPAGNNAPPPANAAKQPSGRQATAQTLPPASDPGRLLANFLNAYERGETQPCMEMLDDEVRTNVGGKDELRREYEALFQNTDLRHVRILNMNWSYEGGRIRGEGLYRDSLMNKGETLLRTRSGQIRVEFVRRGDAALIQELYFLSGRS